MGFRDEADMQARIALLLKTGAFVSAIRDKDKITHLAKETSDTFPIFAIDRVARAAMIAAAAGCLNSLNDLSILTEDENVSSIKNETLRPDFVCISLENQSLFLIELKNSAQTAREAITELLGYEHEIKNYLPFLADWDVNYIIISAEWSTLLDHSASSACCWSRKKLLCLEADLVGDDVQLKPRIPSSWSITGAVRFPPGSMPTFQISIDQHADGIDERFRLVLNLLGRIGDRLGAHGFAMLWKDRLFQQNSRYHITLAGISPSSFFRAALDRGNINIHQGHLAEPLLKAVENEEATPDSLLRLYSEIKPILQEFSRPEIEGFFDWSVAEQTYLFRAEPVAFEFWGLLGDHARSYVLNPAVRAHRRQMLRDGLADWTEPLVGLFLVKSFFGQAFLASGEIRLQDAFMLGVAIGLDRSLRGMIADKANSEALHILEPRFVWNSYTLAFYLSEIELVINSVKNVDGPKSPFVFSQSPLVDLSDNYAKYESWLRDEFFKERAEFIDSFELGLGCSIVLDEKFRAMSGGAFDEAYGNILKSLNQWKQAALKFADDPDVYKNKEQEKAILHLRHLDISNISDAIEIMNILDFFIPVVFHELNDVAMTNIDWAWLKQGVLEMRERGEMPAVVLDASGNLGTMKITDPIMKVMGDVSDKEKQVLFLNRFSGMATLTKTDWADLESGVALKIT